MSKGEKEWTLFRNMVVMLQITLSLHNKPMNPHSEAPESLSDPQKRDRSELSTALTHCYRFTEEHVCHVSKVLNGKQQELYLALEFVDVRSVQFLQ